MSTLTKVGSIKCPKCCCDDENMIKKWRMEGTYACLCCGQIFDLEKSTESGDQDVKS